MIQAQSCENVHHKFSGASNLARNLTSRKVFILGGFPGRAMTIHRLSTRTFLLLIVALALSLRLIYLVQIADNPFFAYPNNDPLTYDTMAQDIANGNWVGDDVFFKAPFYPYFLALIYTIFGHSYFIPRLIQTVIGAFTCLLVYALARQFFDESTARLAALFAAIYGMFIYFENELLITFSVIFFSLMTLVFLARATDSGKWWHWFLAGVFCGLTAIARPNILLFCPLIPLWLLVRYTDSGRWLKSVRSTVLVAVGALLIILPITLRNYVVGNDFVLISAQGGIAFQAGNNADFDGVFAVPSGADQVGGTFWEDHCTYIAEQALGHALKPSEVSRYWFDLGWDFIFQQPAEALKLYLKKTHLFFHGYELGNNQDIYAFQQYGPLLRYLPVRFGWIVPLALIGAFLATRRQFRPTSLLFFFSFAYFVSVILFFVSARHRLPVVPIMLIFAAYALLEIYRQLRARQWAVLKWVVPVYLIMFAGLNYPFYDVFERNVPQEQFNLGSAYYRAGQYLRAEDAFNQVVALNPQFPRANLNLGVIYLDRNELEIAQLYFEKELKINPQDEMAFNNMGIVYEKRNQLPEAMRHFRMAISIRPTYREAYLNLGRVLTEMNQAATAFQTYRDAIERLGGDHYLYFLASQAALEAGDPVVADEWIQKARDVRPDRAEYWHQQALVENARGNALAAQFFLQKAIELNPDNQQLYHDLGTLYLQNQRLDDAKAALTTALDRGGQFPQTYYNLGLIALAEADTSQAIQLFQTASRIDTAFVPARTMLNQIVP